MGNQTAFPGTEISTVPEVVKAAEFYCEARDEVTTAKERQEKAKTALMKAMKDADLPNYERDGFVIRITAGTPSVDVKRAKG